MTDAQLGTTIREDGQNAQQMQMDQFDPVQFLQEVNTFRANPYAYAVQIADFLNGL